MSTNCDTYLGRKRAIISIRIQEMTILTSSVRIQEQMPIHFTTYLGKKYAIHFDIYLGRKQPFISKRIEEEMTINFTSYLGGDSCSFHYPCERRWLFRKRQSLISIPIQKEVVIHFSAYIKETIIHFNIYLEGDIHTFQYMSMRKVRFISEPKSRWPFFSDHIQEEMTNQYNTYLRGNDHSV